MSDLVSRIIAAAAKAELTPLGFRQKGRSRLWFADRGSWLNVVEFTPSRWSRSVSLVNAAHWLWVGTGFLSFDETISSNCHADFETEDQFKCGADEIAKVARENASAMDERFPSFRAIADFVVERARSCPDRMGPSWWGLEAGIASGVTGRMEEGDRFLRALTDDRVTGRAAPFLPVIKDPRAFREKATEIVAQERARLKLDALETQCLSV